MESPLDKCPDLSQEQGPRPGVSAYMEDMVKEIELTQGKRTQVDDADFEWLSQWKWCVAWNGWHWYAVRSIPCDSNSKQRRVWMHRLITNAQPGEQVDHQDRDGLNNQRENLRPCTQTQNNANRAKKAGCSSKFKGVYWSKRVGKWRSRIKIDGRQTDLGYFDDEVRAARAYDDASLEQYGEFAKLNVIEEA